MKKFIIIAVGALAGLGLALNVSAENAKATGAGAGAAASPAPKASAAHANDKANKNGGGKKLNAKDKRFMQNAAKGGMMEVEMGKMAAQNGKHAAVKKFGNRMVTDHSKMNNELMALAKEEGVALPGMKSPGKWKSDKDYMDMMVKDHEKDLAEFQEEAKNGSDPDLKKLADKGAKTISKHLQMAKETQAKVQ